MPKISVIMSIYKEPIDWIRQSIDSILNQTFEDFEFIIVNDKPDREDNKSILDEYRKRDERVTIINNENNIGLTKSLNKALSVAKGDFIARMDADDICMTNRFEKQIDYLQNHKDFVVLGTNCKFFGEVPIYYKFMQLVQFEDVDIRSYLLYGNCIAHSSVMIRRSVLIENGITYDEMYRNNQDYRLWEMLLPYGKFKNLEDKLLKYRVSAGQITQTKSKDQIALGDSVGIRLIERWLLNNNIRVQYEDLRDKPFEILNKLRHNKELRNQKEYKSFVQYVYLKSHYRPSLKDAMKTGDFWYISNQNKCLYLYNILLK